MSPWLTSVFTISAGVFPPLALICGFLVWIVKAIVRAENVKQTREISENYVPSMKSNLTGAEIGRAIETIRQDMSDMDESRKKHQQAQLDLINILSREVDRIKLGNA